MTGKLDIIAFSYPPVIEKLTVEDWLLIAS